jgi:hypothetical protein
MPQSTNSRRDLLRLVLFTFAAWALWALGRNDAKPGAVSETDTGSMRQRSGFSKRRLAASIAFTTIFFAGAAFTAGAVGQEVCTGTELCDGVTTVTDQPPTPPPPATVTEDPNADGAGATESTPTPPVTPPAEPATPPVQEPSNGGTGEADPGDPESGETGSEQGQGADTSGDGAAPAPGAEEGQTGGGNESGGSSNESGGGNQAADEPDSPAAGPGSENHAGDGQTKSHSEGSPVDVDQAHDAAAKAENASSFGTFWLHRVLPDPTPPARRLDPRFARNLVAVSSSHHVDWALVLAVLRAHGHRSSVPASKGHLKTLASNLRERNANQGAWEAVLSLEGRTAFADRTIALRNYNRAVGLRTLVRGLVASKGSLQDRVLADRRISIYAGGRSDIAAGRVDVRVLALLRYLAQAHGQVTVSCLISGHGLYARPGVVSAHIYGEAVDISALGGVSIYGNQAPGGLTEKAVRNILLLPVELQPRQVISLLGLGGPSFALANHYDHIHVGF